MGKILAGKHPERLIEKAVERMIPAARSAASRWNLFVYAGH